MLIRKLLQSLSDSLYDEEYVTTYLRRRLFINSTKKNWVNKPLIEVLSNEFSNYSIEYFVYACKHGFISVIPQSSIILPMRTTIKLDLHDIQKTIVSDKLTDNKIILKQNHNIKHDCLLVDGCVLNKRVEILYDNENFIIVYKPSGIPCYPQGSIETYSLTDQLKLFSEYYTNFYLTSRLDRVTSGIILMQNRNSEVDTSEFNKSIKFYICQWANGFDEVLDNIVTNNNYYKSTVVIVSKSIILVNCGIKKGSVKGLPLFCYCDYEGRVAKSLFIKLYNNLVIAIPITGRTHQLRVHSVFLQTKILHDELYKRYSIKLLELLNNNNGLKISNYENIISYTTLKSMNSYIALIYKVDSSYSQILNNEVFYKLLIRQI